LGNLTLPIKFLDEYLPKADPSYIVVYLYAYRFVSQGEKAPSNSQIAAALGIKESDVSDAMGYWGNLGFNLGSKKVIKTLHKSIYTPGEIAQRAKSDKKLSWLFEEAQNTLGKILSSADMLTLFWIYDYLELNHQVIMLIVNYSQKNNKSSMRYIERVATDWADKGIDTVRKAEKHLAMLEDKRTYEYKIKRLLGIYDRDFTPSEKKVVEQWQSELKPSDELVLSAFDINIERTGKLSVKYINGILKSWEEKGIKTPEQILQDDGAAKGGKASKSVNFEQREDIDFDAKELEILKKRMGR